MDSTGNPLRWLDVANKQMDAVVGAVAHAEINPYSSSTTWSPELQTQFKDVLTNPWTATADEKAAYDTFLTTQWQLTLKDAGVANAETLQGYDLLNAIIDHQPPVVLTGNETPEQLASYVVELPFSLQKLVITDQNNLVGYHREDGRYVDGKIDTQIPNNQPPEAFRGPLQKAINDWGYYYAYYGFGASTSPQQDHAALLKNMGYLSSTSTTNPNNYGFDFYGEKIPAIGVTETIDGDIMFLFRITGTDPNTAVGAMIRMYDGSQVHYAEAFLPLTTMSTAKSDTCLKPGLGLLQTIPCQVGISIQDLTMQDRLSPIPPGRGSLYFLLKLMSVYKNPHVSIEGEGTISQGGWIWKNGIPVQRNISTPNISKSFFTKP
jgi:hypothetical protein